MNDAVPLADVFTSAEPPAYVAMTVALGVMFAMVGFPVLSANVTISTVTILATVTVLPANAGT